MEFVIGTEKCKPDCKSQQVGNYFICYTQNNRIAAKELLIETEDHLVLADANYSFCCKIKSLKELDNINKHINLLTNGFVIHKKSRD